MEIKELKVTVGEVYEGYFNDAETENGVVGYGEQLNIRPKAPVSSKIVNALRRG